jgi:hypothetical protein
LSQEVSPDDQPYCEYCSEPDQILACGEATLDGRG